MAGHAAEIKFDVYAMEYSGETIAEYPVSSGKRYRILRTYIHNDGELVELTLSSFPEAQSAAKRGGRYSGRGRRQWRNLTLSGLTT